MERLRSKWICCHCRKMFRRPVRAENWDATSPCPQCHDDMAVVGPNFEPPKRSNKRTWTVIETWVKRRRGLSPRSTRSQIDSYLESLRQHNQKCRKLYILPMYR